MKFMDWEFYNGCELIDVNFYDDASLDVFNENCGSKYVKLFNNNSIYQIIHTPGLKDDYLFLEVLFL